MLLAGGIGLAGCATTTTDPTTSPSTSSSTSGTITEAATVSTTDATTTEEMIADPAAAAGAFLATLTDEQRQTVHYD